LEDAGYDKGVAVDMSRAGFWGKTMLAIYFLEIIKYHPGPIFA
jgi:hypothetical protein